MKALPLYSKPTDSSTFTSKWMNRNYILIIGLTICMLLLYTVPWCNANDFIANLVYGKPHVRPGNMNVKNTYGINGEQRLPQVIIIGVRKAGTRALLNYIKHHPDIETANSECHFFGDTKNYRQGLDFYRRQMPYSLPNQITIEKTPNYFHHTSAAKRIQKMNSTIKLILVVREPAKRAESDYWQFEWRNKNETRTFRQCALKSDGEVKGSYGPVFRSNYYHILKQYWLPYFNISQIFVVNGDALGHENPGKEMRKVQDFIGVQNVITEDSFVFDKDKGFYCFKEHGRARCLGDSKGRKIQVAKENTELILKNYYTKYNRRLFRLIGRDFGWSS